ncbi:MAG: right-handed parallel beta-helix repeat-containing protein, partial [Saprospiraceae bacterium]|nr:right-handed parallel beta-helix repeat-containing protein [Saprospiraceae bacterium]
MKKHIHPCSGKTHWFSQIGPSAPYAFALAVALALGNIVAFAQISIPNTSFTYTENFNTLPISGTGHTAVPAGWAFFETLVGYSGANTYRAGDASGDYWQQTYDTYSLGATGTSDRAFGSITSTGQDSLNTTIGVCFTNNTGAPITSLTASFTGETWAVNSPNRTDGLQFFYNQNTTAINGTGTWTLFPGLNYYNPGSSTLGSGSVQHSAFITATISGLNIAPGNTFCFRWLDIDAIPSVPNQNLEDAVGIDDFSLSNIVACSSASILYVNDDATGANDGSSWTNAFNDLQSALALATQCPNITQIWVAAGTYKPTSSANRNISFSMKDGVAIYGGFPGLPGQEGNFGVRDWVANVTTLSGEIGAAGMADNTFNIVRNGSMSSTAILDGFQIAFGNASGGNDRGGALHNEANASPTIRNCSFLSNLGGYGGAIYSFTNCTPTFTNCTFIGNQGNAWGTLFTEGSSFYTFVNCSFSGNTGNPGVIYSNGQPAVLKNCIIWGNGTQAIA